MMEKILNSFMNECSTDFIEYFERHMYKNVVNREDYKILSEKRHNLLEEFPRVRNFVEDHEVEQLSLAELKVLIELKAIDDEIDTIEHKEAFKLGAKEAYIFYEEMGMLNI